MYFKTELEYVNCKLNMKLVASSVDTLLEVKTNLNWVEPQFN